MARRKRTTAVFPGTFDPITSGHLDVIARGAALFDELIVAVGDNPRKGACLSAARRAAMVHRATAGLNNVRVATYRGLTVDFARRAGARAILRGLRDAADLAGETQMALTNRHVSGIETLFVLPGPDRAYISSTLVRQIAAGGGDVSGLVPPEVLGAVRAAYGPAGPRGRKK